MILKRFPGLAWLALGALLVVAVSALAVAQGLAYIEHGQGADAVPRRFTVLHCTANAVPDPVPGGRGGGGILVSCDGELAPPLPNHRTGNISEPYRIYKPGTQLSGLHCDSDGNCAKHAVDSTVRGVIAISAGVLLLLAGALAMLAAADQWRDEPFESPAGAGPRRSSSTPGSL